MIPAALAINAFYSFWPVELNDPASFLAAIFNLRRICVTPKAGKGTGMVAKAEELCAEHGWFLCSQFENDANPAFHASTTGPEGSLRSSRTSP